MYTLEPLKPSNLTYLRITVRKTQDCSCVFNFLVKLWKYCLSSFIQEPSPVHQNISTFKKHLLLEPLQVHSEPKCNSRLTSS